MAHTCSLISRCILTPMYHWLKWSKMQEKSTMASSAIAKPSVQHNPLAVFMVHKVCVLWNSKTTQISLYILPNSTISLRVLRNFLNVTNLKQLKYKIFFSGQPSTLKREVTQPSFTRKFYENSPFVKQKYILRWESSNDLWAMCYHAGRHFTCYHPRNNVITKYPTTAASAELVVLLLYVHVYVQYFIK